MGIMKFESFVNEGYEESSLYQDIKELLRNSNQPPKERANLLRMIADEIDSHISNREETADRWSKESERTAKLPGLDPKNEF